MDQIFFSPDEILEATGGYLLGCNDSFKGVNSILTDSRADCSGAMFIALCGEHFDGHLFLSKAAQSGAELLCVEKSFTESNDVSNLPLLVVDDTTKAYQDLARFHRRRLGLKVIGITGSTGKTSTKEIMHSVLVAEFGDDCVYSTKANTNNHIGVPQNLLNLTADHKVAVIEMGSNHIGEIEVLSRTAEPDVAIVTSVGSSHLEFFKTIENVAHEKATIFKHLKPSGVAVIPSDCEYRSILESYGSSAHIIAFGEDIRGEYKGSDLTGGHFDLMTGESAKIEVDWPVQGRHQMNNALAVVAAAHSIGLSYEVIVKGLKKSMLTGMRLRVRNIDGVNWVNDAYNANPESTKAGLSWLSEFADPQSLVIILGDMLELGDSAYEKHLETLNYTRELFPDSQLFCVGPILEQVVNDLQEPENVCTFKKTTEATDIIRDKVKSGDIVYLKGSRGTHLEVIEPDNSSSQ